jgi:hypothetical protein
MKHLKLYTQYIKESIKFENTKNFQIGDIVICIDNSSTISDYNYSKYLKMNNIYQIENIKKFDDCEPIEQLKLVNVRRYWEPNRFRLAAPEEIITKKYNL